MKTIFIAVTSAIIGGLVAALFVLGGMEWLGAGSGEVTIQESSPPPVSEESSTDGAGGADSGSSVGEVYASQGPGVVSVDVASDLGAAGGSGFVLDDSGHIVTNQHVVEGANEVSVRFSGGARRDARIVGEDPSTDVAVIRVDAPRDVLMPLTLGDSDALRVGEPVIAMGNPLNVGVSVTTGIVSGIGRPITAPNNYTIDDAVQTDAAISSGNSGGPLLDSRGTVIGINSQVASGGSTGVAQGVGFAVPINTVKNVVEQLITTGDVEHGYIGVQMFSVGMEELEAYSDLSQDQLREEHGLPENGAIVSEVTPDGPADEAGIAGGEEEEIGGLPVPIGDVITKVGNQMVRTPDDVISVVNSRSPGDRIDFTVVTPGEEPRQVEITIGSQPEGS
ncbi:MAG: S1C family serine protease [Rubrobacteraceae bacterium]